MKRTRYSHLPVAIFETLFALGSLLLLCVSAPAATQQYQYGNLCNDCHAMPPIDAAYRNVTTGGFKGSHSTHNPPSVAPKAVCEKCHFGSGSYSTDHMDTFIQMTSNINNSPHPSRGTYNKPRFFNQTSNPVMQTCANVNCHFEQVTPLWSNAPFSSPADCNGCHGAAPADGSHPATSGSGKKHGDYYTTTTSSCLKCHPDHTADAAPFAHATSSGKRGLLLQFTASPNTGGAYSGTVSYPNYLPSQSPARNGACSSLYCHSPGTKNSGYDAPNTAAQWGGSLTCKGCHKSDSASGDSMNTGSHAAHVSSYSIINCVKCHAATVTGGMTISALSNHVNGQVNVAFNSTTTAVNGSYNGLPSPMTKTPGSGYGSCQNVYCHSTVQPDGGVGAPAYATPAWGNSGTVACGACHAGDGSHTVGVMSTGSHTKHLAYKYTTTSTMYKCVLCHKWDAAKALNGCDNCHGSQQMLIKHADHRVDIAFDAAYGAGSYSGNPQPGDGYSTCSNVYCHSDGKATPSTYATPTWGNPASAACGSCHGANAAAPPASTPHAKHVDNSAVYKYACARCHVNTVKHTADSTTFANITSYVYHVNKSRDVSFDTFNTGATYTAAGQTCNGAYCHSIGNTSVAAGNLPGVYAGDIHAAPTWSGAVSCNSCHGRSTSNGMPDYTNAGAPGSATSNSHSRHVSSSNIPCMECHYLTTKNNTSIRPDVAPSYHVNGTTHDVFFNLSGNNKSASPYDDVNKNCSNTYCHGAGASLAWGGTTYCNTCHSANAGTSGGGGINNWGGTPLSAHKLHVEETTLLPTKYNNYSTGNLSAGAGTYRFGCASCHNPTQAAHVNGYASGSYRAQVFFGYTAPGLKPSYSYGGSAGTADNGFGWSNGSTVCTGTYCHSNGQSGAGWAAGTAVSWTTTTGTANCGLCHGTATSDTLSGKHQQHVNNAAILGVNFGCVDCHAKTVSNNTTISDKSRHVNKFRDYSGVKAGGSATYAAGSCSGTYCHTSGKKGIIPGGNEPAAPNWTSGSLDCKGCHGKTSSKAGEPDYASVGVGLATSNSHAEHVGGASDCVHCHQTTTLTGMAIRTGSVVHIDRNIDVRLSKVSAYTTYSGVYNNSARTCSATYCHGSSTTPGWGGSTTCESCHKASNALPDGHTIHYAGATPFSVYTATPWNRSSAGSYLFTCSSCHPRNISSHANGPVAANSAANLFFGFSSAGRNPAWTPGGTNKTDPQNFNYTTGTGGQCNTTYCHSSGTNVNGNNAAYTWATAQGTIGCKGCHNYTTGSGALITTGKHGKHADGATYNYNCAKCHNSTTTNGTGITDKSRHVNKVKDVVWDATNSDGTAYVNASTNCSNIYCHSLGTASGQPYPAPITPVNWGSGALGCNGCHGDAATTGGNALSGKHPQHVNNAAVIGTNFGCVDCHAKTVSDNSTISTYANHVNKFKDYSGVKAGGSSTYAAGSCSGTYCHTSGKKGIIPGGNEPSAPNWTTGSLDCKGCHGKTSSKAGEPDYASVGTGLATSNSHAKHVGGASDCIRCHFKTTATGTVIIGGSTHHIDKNIDVNISKVSSFTTYSGVYDNSARTCSATYCHGGTVTSPAWGGTTDCQTCHKASNAASGLSAGHLIHYATATLFTTYTATPGNRSSGGNYIFACSSCHPRNLSSHANGPAAANSAANLFFGFSSAGRNPAWTPGGTTGTDTQGFNYTNGTGGQCNTTYCHSSGTDVNGNNAAYTWATAQGTIGCKGCHNYTTGSGALITTGKHGKHVDGTTYSYNCAKCHNATTTNGTGITDKSRHVNKIKDVVWDATNSDGTAYVNAPTNCSNIYCHSLGTAASQPYPAPITPVNWGSGALGCNGCHGNAATAGGNALSGKHPQHVNNASVIGTNFGCIDCHAKTVSDNSTISTYANHVNKFKDYSGVKAAGSATYAAGSCSSTYCHTSGKKGIIPGGNEPAAPNWTSGSLDCKGCHGKTSSKAGEPDYASVGVGLATSNSHAKHVGSASDCIRCHFKTTATGTSIIGGSTHHIDKNIDVNISKMSTFTTYSGVYNTSARTCSATYCHGSTLTSPAWGGTTDCQTCHKASNAASGLSAGHLIHYATATVFTTYTATPGNRSSVGSYIFACPSCHPRNITSHANGPVAANSAANLFFGFSSAGRNPAWTPGGTTGTDPQGFNYTNGTGGQCNTTYCHSSGTDVDGNNAAYTWATAQGTIGCKGCHNYTTGSGALITTGKHSKHADGSTYNYNCAKCHNATTTNGTGITDKSRHVNKVKDVVWDATNSDGTAYVNASTACSNIYCHSQGTTFAQPYTGAGKAPLTAVTWGGGQTLGCDGCHGNSTYTGYRNAFPLYNSGSPKGNAHQLHADARTTPANEPQCLHCHSGTTTTNTSITGYANHVNESYNVAAGGTYKDGDNVGGAAVAVTVNYTYNAGDSSCNTVSCHPTGLGDANKAATVAYWNNNYQCSDCHKIDLINTSGYHHAMRNYSAGNAAYPAVVPQGDAASGTNSNSRRCTMCHVDHSIFSPMLNTNSNARANNLRTDIAVTPTATGGYTNSDYIGTSGGTGGICITCHTTELTKSTTRILTETSSTKTAAVPFTDYSGSAHEYAIASTMNGPTGGTFQANCSKCHNGRKGESAVFSSMTTITHDNNRRRLYASLGVAGQVDGNDANFCYGCHKGASSKDYYNTAAMSTNAKDTFNSFSTSTRVYRHNVNKYNALHRPSPTDETRQYISGNKHISCNDCHNPHETRDGNHTKGNAALANVLKGASGVTVTTWGGNWAGVTTWGQTATQALPAATAEWQVCFKCHSGANSNVTSWGGSGAAAWTDLALEFNPNNEAYHPVIQPLPATGNRRLAAGALTGGWAPGSVMTCSDCHSTDSAASSGPHGSTVKWMLNPNTTGTKYYNWPYTLAANNGKSTGTLVNGTGNGTVPGSNFCFSCHTWSGGGPGHTGCSSHAVACVRCHIRVPHGGKVPRLLTTLNAPSRYKPDGAGGGGTPVLNGVNRPASGTMSGDGGSSSNCNTTGGCNYSGHTGTVTFSW